MDGETGGYSASKSSDMKKQEKNNKRYLSREVILGSELWTDGLICAFEFVGSRSRTSSLMAKCPLTKCLTEGIDGKTSKQPPLFMESDGESIGGQNYTQGNAADGLRPKERYVGNYWIPIGLSRISELLQTVQVDGGWASKPIDFSDEGPEVTVADVAAPYWERPVGPTWWCHVDAGHPSTNAWLNDAQWLHLAISVALRDESKLISERMKHLFYE